MTTVIEAVGLGKRYRRGVRVDAGLRHVLEEFARSPWKFTVGHLVGRKPETFWALKDVSLEVKEGEVLGLIGRNGAGKTTLLKILSRITRPTTGHAEIRGHVRSLLEVGTGFHGELTGRENTYFSGSLLGMKKREIDQKLDEIVAFAEIEKFIDTPVKHYSSGMYVRLAFAVAAHLEPEILIVDEVLAVGDSGFQRKCLGRMEAAARDGRTVLFVTHNMAALRALCNRAVILESGHVSQDTRDILQAVARYSAAGGGVSRWQRGAGDFPAGAKLAFSKFELDLLGDQPLHRLAISVEVQSLGQHRPAFLAFDVIDSAGAPLMQALPQVEPRIQYSSEAQNLVIEIDLPPLIPGPYRVGAWVGSHFTETYDSVPPVLEFTIESSPVSRSFPHSANHGSLVPHSYVVSRQEAIKC